MIVLISNIKNHALLSDYELFCQLPQLNINISDDIQVLLDILATFTLPDTKKKKLVKLDTK